MDDIDRFIETGRVKTQNLTLMKSTWTDFYTSIKNKKLILYGLSNSLDFLWIRRCNNDVFINDVIDNDVKIQGHRLGEFLDEDDLKNSKDILISSKDRLEQYNPDEIVILISSLRYPEEIATELDSLNFHYYFSILHLEYNYREYMKQNNLFFETQDSYRNNYAKDCIEKNLIQPKKIVFVGGLSMNYSDHGKYLTKQLLSADKNIDIVWILNDISNDIPNEVKKISKRNLKKTIYELETAKIWIFSDPIPNYLIKRKQQIYIQLKHWGSITLKKFYLDVPLIANGKSSKDIYESNGRLTDYIISGSQLDEDSCRSGFNFHGEFIRCGSPRSDALFLADDFKDKVYNYYHLKSDDHILLYAPTFRIVGAQMEQTRYSCPDILNLDKLFETLNQKWKFSWKILLRLHPLNRIQFKQTQLPDYVIDASDYEDSQELVAVSDIMVSDYSSIMFEMAYVQKPVFLYAPDKDDYVKNEREFLIDYDTLPFPISTTNEELADQIKNFDENKYKSDIQAFLDKYGVHEDGHASERAAKFILKLLGENV